MVYEPKKKGRFLGRIVTGQNTKGLEPAVLCRTGPDKTPPFGDNAKFKQAQPNSAIYGLGALLNLALLEFVRFVRRDSQAQYFLLGRTAKHNMV